ncbi:hypothetical protein [Nocardioides sp. Soil805]|uniref:hypothetical protein n=1 Tax=Nocardioides sp. Soil805 TaxID=1736416 RepID=UPI0007035D71|nr:hypothetical protein [Nocardioides sp. Soil805]KRF35258.1 hypothetical protein ASG94_14230 [Nocardioides sp. Soil805]
MTTTLEPGTTPGTTTPTGRRWLLAGVGAGLAGVASIAASMGTGAVYEPDIAGDAPAIAARLAEMTTPILVFHVATMVSALLLVVFAAGLHRDMAGRLPTGSTLPTVALSGLLLVSAAQLLGSGLTTEFVFGLAEGDQLVPEVGVFFGHWLGTIPWLWGTAGLTAVALGMAARAGGYARWLGLLGYGLGALLLLLAVSPLQYMAGMVGPVWLTVTAVGLLASRRGR